MSILKLVYIKLKVIFKYTLKIHQLLLVITLGLCQGHLLTSCCFSCHSLSRPCLRNSLEYAVRVVMLGLAILELR